MQVHGICVGGCTPGPVGGHADTWNTCGWMQAWTSRWPCRHTEAVQTHGTRVGGCRPGPVGGRADTRNMGGWVQVWTSGWPCGHTEHGWVGACLDQWVAMQTHGTWVGGCRPGPVGGHAADIWSLCVCSRHGTVWNVYRTQLLRSSGQTAWCRGDHGPISTIGPWGGTCKAGGGTRRHSQVTDR